MKEPINNKVELHKENMEKLDLEKGGLFEMKDIEEKNVTILNDSNSKNMTM